MSVLFSAQYSVLLVHELVCYVVHSVYYLVHKTVHNTGLTSGVYMGLRAAEPQAGCF